MRRFSRVLHAVDSHRYVAMNINVLWRYFFFAGYLEFPDTCEYPESFERCRGACPLLDYRIDELTPYQARARAARGRVWESANDVARSVKHARV